MTKIANVRRRLKRYALGASLLAVLCAGAYAGWLIAINNFHVVIPGVLYRSAQPGSVEIADYKARYGIKTIINLRGASPNKFWYQQEMAESASQGIDHIDFGMSASQEQQPEKLQGLIEILSSARQPILIHCERGADRSGLVAALYLVAIEKKDAETAEAQLSIRYGHFSIPVLSQAYPMDQSFEKMEDFLGYTANRLDRRIKTSS